MEREGPEVWRNRHRFRAAWSDEAQEYTPEAWSSGGRLPHLVGRGLDELFPIATVAEAQGDEDPVGHDELERRGVAECSRRRGETRENAPALLLDSQSGVRGEGGGS